MVPITAYGMKTDQDVALYGLCSLRVYNVQNEMGYFNKTSQEGEFWERM